MNTVTVSVPVLRWAGQRARLGDDALSARFRKWPLWLSGEAQPTLKQLEDFARLTHTAIGYFFLPQPPAPALPVPDFRTVRDEALAEPSSDLLDTICLCQRRRLLPIPGRAHQQALCPCHRVQHAGGLDLVSGCLSHARHSQTRDLL